MTAPRLQLSRQAAPPHAQHKARLLDHKAAVLAASELLDITLEHLDRKPLLVLRAAHLHRRFEHVAGDAVPREAGHVPEELLRDAVLVAVFPGPLLQEGLYHEVPELVLHERSRNPEELIHEGGQRGICAIHAIADITVLQQALDDPATKTVLSEARDTRFTWSTIFTLCKLLEHELQVRGWRDLNALLKNVVAVRGAKRLLHLTLQSGPQVFLEIGQAAWVDRALAPIHLQGAVSDLEGLLHNAAANRRPRQLPHRT